MKDRIFASGRENSHFHWVLLRLAVDVPDSTTNSILSARVTMFEYQSRFQSHVPPLDKIAFLSPGEGSLILE
jgi:hypothetical protein